MCVLGMHRHTESGINQGTQTNLWKQFLFLVILRLFEKCQTILVSLLEVYENERLKKVLKYQGQMKSSANLGMHPWHLINLRTVSGADRGTEINKGKEVGKVYWGVFPEGTLRTSDEAGIELHPRRDEGVI